MASEPRVRWAELAPTAILQGSAAYVHKQVRSPQRLNFTMASSGPEHELSIPCLSSFHGSHTSFPVSQFYKTDSKPCLEALSELNSQALFLRCMQKNIHTALMQTQTHTHTISNSEGGTLFSLNIYPTNTILSSYKEVYIAPRLKSLHLTGVNFHLLATQKPVSDVEKIWKTKGWVKSSC